VNGLPGGMVSMGKYHSLYSMGGRSFSIIRYPTHIQCSNSYATCGQMQMPWYLKSET